IIPRATPVFSCVISCDGRAGIMRWILPSIRRLQRLMLIVKTPQLQLGCMRLFKSAAAGREYF
ncbi:MAG: hypothetical protein AAFN70_17625, partial [Planctomycetota bacterium]